MPKKKPQYHVHAGKGLYGPFASVGKAQKWVDTQTGWLSKETDEVSVVVVVSSGAIQRPPVKWE